MCDYQSAIKTFRLQFIYKYATWQKHAGTSRYKDNNKYAATSANDTYFMLYLLTVYTGYYKHMMILYTG